MYCFVFLSTAAVSEQLYHFNRLTCRLCDREILQQIVGYFMWHHHLWHLGQIGVRSKRAWHELELDPLYLLAEFRYNFQTLAKLIRIIGAVS